mmetsp:Transcript_13866/g.23897  ORF Transcript_13866/g.23897 Transcript_13866/m.23897 type:complete len:966 (+) Transcript_13866:56-2953(+)
MSCCGTPEPDEEEQNVTKADEPKQFGPAPNRSCTDCWCLIVLAASWVCWAVVTTMGLADGNLARLYQPRDYMGAYCDVEDNWNGGLNLKGYPKQSFTMNISAITDIIVKQMLCSTAAAQVLSETTSFGPPLLAFADSQAYLASCCRIPSEQCEGTLQVGGDLASTGAIATVITEKLEELTGKVSADNLFSPSGGQAIQDLWSEANLYFNEVCLTSCAANFALVNASVDTSDVNSTAAIREYVFSMAPDNELKLAYDTIATYSGTRQDVLTIRDVVLENFKFDALPLDICPYSASRCVPMPGVEFTELVDGSSYCTFKMSADVIAAVGDVMSDTLEALGINALSASLMDTVGTWIGDFQTSIDAFLLVLLSSFVVGFIYMVMLRFLIGICVWLSVCVFFLILCFAGFFSFITSSQCAGVGIFETGQTILVGAATTTAVAIQNIIDQTTPASEALSGLNGGNYTGVQTYTKMGYYCADWGLETNLNPYYNSTNYPQSNLVKNYCRNPFDMADKYKARTIWCHTTDPEVRWQECNPIGVIRPVCTNGFEVASEELRVVLEILAYVLWVLAFIYAIVVCCLTDRIRLAIAVNKVASVFVVHTPRILLLPVIQAIFAGLWTLAWCFSAAFLLSQVPADYVPTTAFATYAEAYGTDTVAGKCTGTWPTGAVWKDEENCESIVNGTETIIACWRCSQPRYSFDWRFWVSFFNYLWNSALNIALGQLIIAGAVCVWFFTPNNEKGSRKAFMTSVYNAFRYHLGSVAFGAFIIAVIQLIRYLLKYYEKQAKAQKNRILVCILKVLQCFIWCFEKCVKFLNKNAYIQIALYGTPFCTSAKKAFFLILRNALRFGTIAILGSVIHIIGIMFIVAGTGIIGYFILSGLHPNMAPAIPILIYLMLGYTVARLFTSIFELAVDTTLQCFLCCEELNIAELGDDGFVPSQLEPWLDKSQPPEKASEKKVADDEEKAAARA